MTNNGISSIRQLILSGGDQKKKPLMDYYRLATSNSTVFLTRKG